MDDPSDFLIRARLDASEMAAGADEGVSQIGRLSGALGDVGESAEKGEKGIGKMLEEAGGMQEARRLTAGLFDVLEGGGRTVEGVTDLLRFMLLTVVDINPLMLGATVILGSVAAAVAKHYGEIGSGSEKAKRATDSVSDSFDSLGGHAGTAKDLVTSSLDGIVAHEKSLEEASKRQLNLLRDRATATRELLEANKRNAIEAARQDYLAGNKQGMSDEELERRRRSFEALQKDIEGESTVNSARLDRDEASENLAATQRELATAHQAIRDLQDALDKAQDKGAEARNLLAASGVRVGAADAEGNRKIIGKHKNGEEYDFGEWAQQQINSGQADVNVTREELRKGQFLPNDVAAAQADVAARQKEIDALSVQLAALRNAARDYDVYPDAQSKITPKIDEQQKAIDDLYVKVGELTESLAAKSRDADAALAKELNDQKQRTFDAIRTETKERAQKDLENAKGAIQSAIDDTQNALENKSLTDQQREDYERSIGQMKANISELQEAFRQQFHEVTPGEQQEAHSREAGDVATGNKQATDIADTSLGVPAGGRREYDAASAALAELVAQGMARVNAVNNVEAQNALGIEPDDRARAKILQSLFQDSSDPGARDISKGLGKSLSDQADAQTRTGPANQYDRLVGQQAEIVDKIAGVAVAEGLQKLTAATQKGFDTHSKINDIMLAAIGVQNSVIQQALTQLETAQRQLDSLRTNRH